MERCECCGLLLGQPGVKASDLPGTTVCEACVDYAIETVWLGEDPRIRPTPAEGDAP